MRVLNSSQMREADRRTIEDLGIPSLVLMENAGRQVVAAVEAIHTDLAERQVAVLCGRGNNGGDGFVVARTLLQRGVDTSVFLIGQVSEVRGDARVNLDILGRLGVTVVEIADGQAWELHFSEIEDCTLIIDAIFGTGLNAPLSGLMETVVADVNASGIQIVSIDLPSGLSADSHEPIGDSIEAGLTVTLGAPKLPLVLPPAETRAGDIVIADIGIPAEVFEALEGPRVELLTRASARELISPRTPDTHKGDYGRVLIVAGSRGKTGAAYLAALGALRSGAGLVTVATGASSQPVLATMAPEYMTEAIAEAPGTDGELDPDAVDRVLELARDVVAVGPGLGQGASTRLLREDARRPGDHADRHRCGWLERVRRRSGRPHGARRAGRHHHATSRRDGTAGRHVDRRGPVRAALEIARNFATGHQLLRGAQGTSHPDRHAGRKGVHQPDRESRNGDRRHRATCSPGMIAAWLAQLLDAEGACRLAVYLHGMAGDLAEADEGEIAMTSGDVAGHLGDAVMELTARRKVVDRNGS